MRNCSRPGDIHNAGFGVGAAGIVPVRVIRPPGSAEAKGFLQEDKPVRMRMGEDKTIVVAAGIRLQTQIRLQLRSLSAPPEELVVGAALPLHEFLQPGGAQHPAQHFEEANEVGLPGTVGADHHGDIG